VKHTGLRHSLPGCLTATRAFARATLRRWQVADRGDDIVTVVSELLTNALRHGIPTPGGAWPRRPVKVGLVQPGEWVVCAVADPGDRMPVLREPGVLDESGRGLHVVAALSDAWGCTAPGELGKVVWAMFALSR